MAKRRFAHSVRQVAAALAASGGHVGKAAELLNVNDSTLRGVIKRVPVLSNAQKAIIEANGRAKLKK